MAQACSTYQECTLHKRSALCWSGTSQRHRQMAQSCHRQDNSSLRGMSHRCCWSWRSSCLRCRVPAQLSCWSIGSPQGSLSTPLVRPGRSTHCCKHSLKWCGVSTLNVNFMPTLWMWKKICNALYFDSGWNLSQCWLYNVLNKNMLRLRVRGHMVTWCDESKALLDERSHSCPGGHVLQVSDCGLSA